MVFYKEFLQSRAPFSKLGLEAIQEASALLGHPERAFRSIHIGGTNGKGSVCLKIAKNLEAAGLKVGLYTSPHVSSYRERIQINGQMVSEEWMREKIPLLPENLSFFEMMTLLAFLYFAEEEVDMAVIEVGLGGRLDATNIITPVLSVITSIDYDHMAILGSTLEEIAQEKAGIIKKEVPYVLGPSAAKYISGGYVSPSGSSYDEENTNIAHKALEVLSFPCYPEALKLRPPCRLQTVGKVILDVAHNPAGLKKLFEVVPRPSVALVGMSVDKDLEGSLAILGEHVERVHFIKGRGSRAADPLLLQKLWPGVQPAYAHETIEEGLKAAQRGGALVVATGSFYIMGPIRQLLGIQEPLDDYDFQERFLS